jgi:hypothetical protein
LHASTPGKVTFIAAVGALPGETNFFIAVFSDAVVASNWDSFGPPAAQGTINVSSGQKLSVGVVAAILSQEGVRSGYASLLWSDGTLPGGAPDSPLGYDQIFIPPGKGDAFVEEGSDEANQTTGSYLTAVSPVIGVHGATGPVYFGSNELGVSARLSAASGDSAITGYYFESGGPLFTSFVVPAGLASANTRIRVGGQNQAFDSSRPFVFDTPVSSFSLIGLEAGDVAGSDMASPFVHGFTFGEEGLAVIYQIGLTDGPNPNPVPEPTSLTIFACGAIGLGLCVSRRRRRNPRAPSGPQAS